MQAKPVHVPAIPILDLTNNNAFDPETQDVLWESLSKVGAAVVTAHDILPPSLCEKALLECSQIMMVTVDDKEICNEKEMRLGVEVVPAKQIQSQKA